MCVMDRFTGHRDRFKTQTDTLYTKIWIYANLKVCVWSELTAATEWTWYQTE